MHGRAFPKIGDYKAVFKGAYSGNNMSATLPIPFNIFIKGDFIDALFP